MTAAQACCNARQNWLRNQIIYHEIGEVLADLTVKAREKSLSLDEEQFKDLLSKTLTYAELEDYLNFSTNPSTKSTLLGLTPADIENYNPVKQHLPMVRQVLIPLLEQRLNKKCVELYSFYRPDQQNSATSSSLNLAKAHSLHGIIEEVKNKVKTEEKEIQSKKEQRDKVFVAYFQELLECLSIMKSIVEDIKIKQQARADEIAASWLEDRVFIFAFKIKLLALQVLCETYNAEIVKSLKTIGGHLDSATEQTKNDLSQTSYSLQFFHSIGSEFHKVVEEFNQIKAEIEIKKWGLENTTVNKDSRGASSARSGDAASHNQSSDSSSLDTVREVKDVQQS